MTTPLPSSPFLNSAEFSSFSVVAAASGGLPLQNAAAEISSAEPLSAGPAVVADLSPVSVTTAGTNSAWVRDCDRIELQELLGTGMQTPYPIGPWPVDIDPLAFLRDIPDVWLDPSPEFLRPHRIEPLVIPTAWPELMRERY